MMRVARLAGEIAVNPRLEWACLVCETLGIDDVVCWMNNTDPKVLDLWIAYFSRKDKNAGT